MFGRAAMSHVVLGATVVEVKAGFNCTLYYEINVTTLCRYFGGCFGLKKAEGLQKCQILLLILNPHVN